MILPAPVTTGTTAIMTFDQMMPETKSTFCFFSISSATCTPTSGLNWSSPYTISTGTPPTLPPRCSTARSTDSFMNWPITPCGPENVLMKPILIFCCAAAGPAKANAATTAPAISERTDVRIGLSPPAVQSSSSYAALGQLLRPLLAYEWQLHHLGADTSRRLVGETTPHHFDFGVRLDAPIKACERNHPPQRRAVGITRCPAKLLAVGEHLEEQHAELSGRQIRRRRRGRVAEWRGVKLCHVLVRPDESHQPPARPTAIGFARKRVAAVEIPFLQTDGVRPAELRGRAELLGDHPVDRGKLVCRHPVAHHALQLLGRAARRQEIADHRGDAGLGVADHLRLEAELAQAELASDLANLAPELVRAAALGAHHELVAHLARDALASDDGLYPQYLCFPEA